MTRVRRLALVFLAFALGCSGGRRGGDACGPVGAAAPVSGFGFTSFQTSGGLGGYADERVAYTDVYNSNFRGDEINLGPSSPAPQEATINLVPSNFTPPEVTMDTGVDARGLGGEARPLFGAAEEENLDVVIRQAAEITAAKRRPRSWKASTLRPNASRLLVGHEDALPQESLRASVHIDGFRARVVLDLVFENDRDQQLAGNFQLRLPDGASVHYLAFGKTKAEVPVPAAPTGVLASMPEIRSSRAETMEGPREARMVPRERAAHAFEETVRQQLDPALAEWTGAGVFSVRLFPLEPKTRHRVVVAYDTDLLPTRGGLLHRLDLPEGVKDVRVELEARGGAVEVAPKVAPVDGVYRWENPAQRTILAGFARPEPVVLQGTDPATGPCFAARVAPTLPDVEAAPRDRAVFLVDTSLSSNPERMNTWLALLREVLTRNRPQLRAFAVLFFNVDAFWWRDGFTDNTPENVEALLGFANGLVLEGATDLDRALRASSEVEGAYDLFLLSDGAATWGEDDLVAMAHRLGHEHALFAYRTAVAGTHVAALEHLARQAGGAVFSVGDAAAVPTAARAHRSRPWRIVGLDVAGATDVMLAGRPASLYPGQTLHVAGRGRPAADAVLELRLEQGGRERTVRVPLGTPLDSPLAARTYGQVAVGQLESVGSEGDPLATAYANHFRVVGRSSSLLMLESEEDYQRFGIEPANDAARVQKEPASLGVARASLEEALLSLADPKQRFLHRLGQLRKLEFMALTYPEGFDAAVAAMDPTAFDVAPERRTANVRLRRQVPRAVAESLGGRTFTYADLRAEAERRRQAGGAWDALKALSSLVEDQPGDLDLARDLGLTAMAWDLDDQAYHILRRVVDRRPYQLPTYLALARCAAAMKKPDLALVHYETALASDATGRYGAFREIATLEYLEFLRGLEGASDFARRRADELEAGRTVREADLLVLLTWNTDDSDVDLHVTDPSGEECYYEHTTTKLGGRITADVTGGFGPEMFVLPKAAPGTYRIEVKYFGSDRTRTSAPSRVLVRIYEDYGRPQQTLTRKTLELGQTEERRTVAIVRR